MRSEMIVALLREAHAMRKRRKLRHTSTIWNRASQLRGVATSTTRPASTRQPLSNRYCIADRDRHRILEKRQRRIGSGVRARARVGVNHQTSAPDAALIPALDASALHPPPPVDDHEGGIVDRSRIDRRAPAPSGAAATNASGAGSRLNVRRRIPSMSSDRAVVDDHDFTRLVVEREQRPDAFDDR